MSLRFGYSKDRKFNSTQTSTKENIMAGDGAATMSHEMSMLSRMLEAPVNIVASLHARQNIALNLIREIEVLCTNTDTTLPEEDRLRIIKLKCATIRETLKSP